MASQILYYGFVDIIDSIYALAENSVEFKALLYEILKAYPNTTVEHFKRFKYPNIKHAEKDAFIDGILNMIDIKISEDADFLRVNPCISYMRSCFEKAKKQKELTFIHEEEPHVWVSNFVQFYRNEILTFSGKSLIFDEEKQVQKILSDENITLGSTPLTNYRFIPSDTNAMIQISDYIVSILRKYIMFLDRDQKYVENDIKSFDKTQMENYILLNNILRESLKFNPMFVHFIASSHVVCRYFYYLEEYSTLK